MSVASSTSSLVLSKVNLLFTPNVVAFSKSISSPKVVATVLSSSCLKKPCSACSNNIHVVCEDSVVLNGFSLISSIALLITSSNVGPTSEASFNNKPNIFS